MNSEEFSLKKMYLNRLWRKLEKARQMKCKPENLLKIRHKIYDTQDEIAMFLVKNNRTDEFSYKRKSKIVSEMFQNLDLLD
jgi:hypothetical protein